MFTQEQKRLLKEYRVTEKQIELIRLVAKHPVFGATERTMGRITPGALRSGVIQEVWLDRTPSKFKRTVKDYHVGHVGDERYTCTTNKWYELGEHAVELMQKLEPGWSYDRPSARWPDLTELLA